LSAISLFLQLLQGQMTALPPDQLLDEYISRAAMQQKTTKSARKYTAMHNIKGRNDG